MKHIYKILICALVLTSTKICACSCKVPESLKEIQDSEFENSECIFIGEVLEVDAFNNSFKFKVIESFKDEKSGEIYNGKYDALCGPIINETGKWLIYGNFNDENQIVINHCGLTRSFNKPENNISTLNPPPMPPQPDEKVTESKDEKEITKWRLRAKSDLNNEIIALRKRKKQKN
ncbi:hypothetical protein [Allomuricauda sp. R78024]|uniref:hypothetical protein n=1 Tax=Allomuricauda sp. R78024 TaxID=3093867 RepID=UPI0037C4FC6C